MKSVLLFLFVINTFNILASEIRQITDFSFSMPILLNPIIKHVRHSNKIINSDLNTPKQCPAQEFTFRISFFSPTKEDNSEYDKFIQIECLDLKYKSKLYIKNGIVMKIDQIDSADDLITYKQTIINKINSLRFDDSFYLNLSKELLIKIFEFEPVLLKLNKGDYDAQITLTVDRDVDVGALRLKNSNFEYRFCYYKGYVENAALFVNVSHNKKIIFSMTSNKNNLVLANVYDPNSLNGFDCGFYPNNGLKFYHPIVKGIIENVTVWSLNGIKHRIYPFDVWQNNGSPVSYNE